MSARSFDIIFLLGAGASAEADIPMSGEMLDLIEAKLEDSWSEYNDLYHHVKSSIYYSAGLKGKYGRQVSFNVETLANTLRELERNEEHPLYPFIASWNSRFVGLASQNFRNVVEFKRKILRELKDWMCPDNPSKGDYYAGFTDIQERLNFPLQVFSLNYDLCVERINVPQKFKIETGFDGSGPTCSWEWERFEHAEDSQEDIAQLYLYKLHGSINWKRDTENNLYCVEQIQTVNSDEMELIFGRDFKLEAADPYLFYAYQFRKATLNAKLIVAIGYSFADDHINKMIYQALQKGEDKKVVVVSHCSTDKKVKEKCSDVAKQLAVDKSKIEVLKGSAKNFFEDANSGETLLKLLPSHPESPF